MGAPRISIIVPCRNAAHLLAGCLDSIAAQEYENKEVIVIDGASTDGTVEMLKEYSGRHVCFRWISEKDDGVYDAMNKGVGMAKGEWVYFLGADDGLYDRNVLSELFADGREADADIRYGNVEFKYSKRVYDGRFDLRRLLFESNICHQAIFYRRSVFETVGLYDTRCTIYADRDFNIRCFLRKNIRITYSDRVIAVYNEKDGLSAAANADPDFRKKQEKYIADYNNKPARALVIWLRRAASSLKKRILLNRKG